jgi:hypothetical protein
MASALKVVVEPLRVCLETMNRNVGVARGLDALDAACAGASFGCGLQLSALRWGIFRGIVRPPEVHPFAAANVAQDLTRLKELIGGHDVETLGVDVETIPFDLPCWVRRKAKLLHIAAAMGGQVLRYLLEFHQLKPDRCALYHAVAFGGPETLRMIWDRMDVEARVEWKWSLAGSIAFHHAVVT